VRLAVTSLLSLAIATFAACEPAEYPEGANAAPDAGESAELETQTSDDPFFANGLPHVTSDFPHSTGPSCPGHPEHAGPCAHPENPFNQDVPYDPTRPNGVPIAPPAWQPPPMPPPPAPTPGH
jgi:hypothetical protein